MKLEEIDISFEDAGRKFYTISPGPDFFQQAAIKIFPLIEHCSTIIVPSIKHIHYIKQELAQIIVRNKTWFLLPKITTLEHLIKESAYFEKTLPRKAKFEYLLEFQELIKSESWLSDLIKNNDSNRWSLANTLFNLCEQFYAANFPYLLDLKKEGININYIYSNNTFQTNHYAEIELFTEFLNKFIKSDNQINGLWQQLSNLAKVFSIKNNNTIVWINGQKPNPIEESFLKLISEKNKVIEISYQWLDKLSISALAPKLEVKFVNCIDLEAQAAHAANLLLSWYQSGKSELIIITTDKILIERVSSLLRKANASCTYSIDSVGRKSLAKSLAAACLWSWFELIDVCKQQLPFASILLEFLQYPYACNANKEFKSQIECWNKIPKQDLANWCQLLLGTLLALGIYKQFELDDDGLKILFLLEEMAKITKTTTSIKTLVHLSLKEFRILLNESLAGELASQITNVEQSIIGKEFKSIVTFASWNSIRTRYYDAVLVCDAGQLFTKGSNSLFFNDDFCAKWNLATKETTKQEQLRYLVELLLNNPIIHFSWHTDCSQNSNQPQDIDPYLLNLEKCLSKKSILEQNTVDKKKNENVNNNLNYYRAKYSGDYFFIKQNPSLQPKPIIQYIPERLNAHQYNYLRNCPYQFFSYVILGLQKLESVSASALASKQHNTVYKGTNLTASYSKRQFGIWVHDILQKYHSQKRANHYNHSEALKPLSLEDISEKFFLEKIAVSGYAISYFRLWKKILPNYLKWQAKQEEQGWNWHCAEVSMQNLLQIILPSSQQSEEKEAKLAPQKINIKLNGRIDRIDFHQKYGFAIIDYKTQTATTLTAKLKQIDENIQLIFYKLLSQATKEFSIKNDIEEALYLSLDKQTVKSIKLPILTTTIKQMKLQLEQDFSALANGVALAAQGKNTTCQICAASSLCRKKYWIKEVLN